MLAVVSSTGCDVTFGEECDFEGRALAHCEGNTYVVCWPNRTWHRSPCEKFCVDPPGDGLTQGAMCALGPEPDPGCKYPDGTSCAEGEGKLITCDSGYRVREADCGGPTLCKSAPDCGSFCVIADTLAAVCTNGSVMQRCQGDAVIFCSCGYATSAQLCEAPRACREEDPLYGSRTASCK